MKDSYAVAAEKGYLAGQAGRPMSECPYHQRRRRPNPEIPRLRYHWRRGWQKGIRELVARAEKAEARLRAIPSREACDAAVELLDMILDREENTRWSGASYEFHARRASAGRIVQMWLSSLHGEGAAVTPERPPIVCLCGSTRFRDEFVRANYERTMAGEIVLSVGLYMHSPETIHGERLGCTPEQKEALDKLHLRKINLCDYVFVLNVGGYIGASTRREIEYAEKLGKRIEYLEPLHGEAKPDKPPCPKCGGAGRVKCPDWMDEVRCQGINGPCPRPHWQELPGASPCKIPCDCGKDLT